MSVYTKLMKDARPINGDEWGSDRQINSENLLFITLKKDGYPVGEGSHFFNWCQHATTDEMIGAVPSILDGSFPKEYKLV